MAQPWFLYLVENVFSKIQRKVKASWPNSCRDCSSASISLFKGEPKNRQSEWRVKRNIFGDFNEVAQHKTSLAKYSIEFNNLVIQTRPHRIQYLRLLGRPYTLLYVSRYVGRLPKTRKLVSLRYFKN